MARGRKPTPLNLTQTESLELKLLVQIYVDRDI